MSQYIEPYLILLVSLFISRYDAAVPSGISLLLAAVISVSLVMISKNNLISSLISAASIVLAVLWPGYLIFIPAISYSSVFRKNYRFAALFLLPELVSLINGPGYDDLLWLLAAVLSTYMAYSCSDRTHLVRQIKELRDTAVEHELMLKDQNRRILESQNDQIYIATLQERNRIAREIHDNVGHMLSRSILQVGALIAVCKDEKLAPLLISLKETLDTAMTNIRNSVHDLHDESVDLSQSINSLCNDFTFCEINCRCDVSRHVPKDIKYCFITITKEALNNIIKHSDADKVKVDIKEHPGFYRLQIEDNGKAIRGITPEAFDSNGIGLSNMKERVSSLNGLLHIQTENGFKVLISIPKQNR